MQSRIKGKTAASLVQTWLCRQHGAIQGIWSEPLKDGLTPWFRGRQTVIVCRHDAFAAVLAELPGLKDSRRDFYPND